jgi:Ca2+/Na+ antiporter
MKITNMIVIMVVGSFLIHYFLMSEIMANSRKNITNSYGKLYISITMALFMVCLEIISHDYRYKTLSLNAYVILLALIIFFIYLYRNQVWINDKEYLKEMIEHHSMALLTSENIVKKTDNFEVSKLAKNIIQQQTDEINKMRSILVNIDNKKK